MSRKKENRMSVEKKTERNLNADLIRCVAVFSVISVHFLLNSGFYGVTVDGGLMFFMCIFRSIFMNCVPLFMLLTGYLMWQKRLSGQYYKGLIKTLEIYVLASIACQLYKKFIQGEAVTLRTALLGILDYDAANYAWYIEMYIGLFLLIPFLNLIWHGLKEKKQKQWLIVTMLLLTFLPKILNNLNFQTAGWFLNPAVSDKYDPIVPGFFTTMYPITYYFIGVYLREYDWKIAKWKNLLLFLVAVTVMGAYNYYRSQGLTFQWLSNSTWGGENLVSSALLFALLLHLDLRRIPEVVKQGLIFISRISLGIYLISWIFDKIVYNAYLKPLVPEVTDRFIWYPLVAAAVFLGSAGGSYCLYLIQDALHIVLAFLTKNARK